MSRHTLTLSALVALTQARAIVTNHCPHDVYIWSIPQVGSSHTDNVPIKSGGRYEEPWRYGTAINPGIAIKISTEANGIHEGKDEIDFAYQVESSDNSKVWVDLSPVRGNAFGNNLAFRTCIGTYKTADVLPGLCDATDEVELILCGTRRTTPAKDLTPFNKIQECYDYHNVYHERTYGDHEPMEEVPQCNHEHDDDQPNCTADCYKTPEDDHHNLTPSPHTEQSYHPLPKPTTDKPYLPPQPQPSTEKPYSPPPKYTSEGQYPPPKHTFEEQYSPPKHTVEQHYTPPPKSTTAEPHYAPPKHTSEQQYVPPKPTTDKPYNPPPKHTSEQQYVPPKPTTAPTQYAPPQHTSEEYYPPPKHTSEHYAPPNPTTEQHYSPPAKPTTDNPQYPPPKHTSEEYHPLPNHTSDEHHPPPEPTTNEYFPPPKQTAGHYPPPKHTAGHYPPPKSTSEEHYAPPKHTAGHYPPPKPTSDEHYPLPEPTTNEYYPPPKQTAESYSPPKPTSDEHYAPPEHTAGYYPPPRPTLDDDEYHPPPRPTWDDQYHPPQSTSEEYYPPSRSTSDAPVYPPPKYTSVKPHYPPAKPTIDVHHQSHHPSPEHTAETSYSPSHHARPNRPTGTPPPRVTPTRRPPHALRPSPTYQPRNLASKPACHKSHSDTAPVQSQCLAKVVYPNRRAALLRDRNNTSVQVKPRATIPLNTVLQREAAKHETATRSVKPTPLCYLVHKYFPDFLPHCDEEALRAIAREIYPHICEPEVQELLPDIDCNQVKTEVKKYYPDVDVLLERTAGDKGHPLDHNTHGDVRSGFLADRNTTIPAVVQSIVSKFSHTSTCGIEMPKECARDLCEYLPVEVCPHFSEVVEFMLELEHGICVNFSLDDEVCDTNTISRPPNSTMIARRSDRACFSWYYEPSVPSAKYDDVVKMIVAVADDRNENPNDYWTKDKCPPVLSRTHLGRAGVCTKPLCRSKLLNWDECQKLEGQLEAATKKMLYLDIDYTTDEEICGKYA